MEEIRIKTKLKLKHKLESEWIISDYVPIQSEPIIYDIEVDKDGNTKYDSVVGTKGYRWLESEIVKELGKENDIDRSYYDALVDTAVESISNYGDFEWFTSDDPYIGPKYDESGRPIYYPDEDDSCPFDIR